MKISINRATTHSPREYRILLGGSLINSIGSAMVFPFFTLYLRQHLDLSLTLIGALLSFWAASSIVGQLAGGWLTDRIGRKPLMLASLASNAVLIIAFGYADTFWLASFVSALLGLTGSIFQPARDAMVADLIPPEKRAEAYARLRVLHNVGVAIGPALGGFLAAQSFLYVFYVNAFALLAFFALTLFFLRETKPVESLSARENVFGALTAVFRDARYMAFCLALSLVVVAGAQMMTVLPVYMHDNFNLGASYFGWVMTTNATLVVLFQYLLTRATGSFARLPLIALGAIFYALATASIALANAFPHFLLAMAVMTLGEMLVAPISTALAADLAPAHMRGRYMAMLGLTWTVGYGVGPMLGGIISDNYSARALWPLMGIAGFFGAAIFLMLARFAPARAAVASSPQ